MELLEPQAPVSGAVLAHYRLVAPLMESLFGGSPLIWKAYPKGLDQDPQWHVHYFGHWTKLTAGHVERLAAIGALEFYSWFPTPDNFDRARYMRLLMHGPAAKLKEAVLAVRAMLFEEGREAVPVLDGGGGIELFVPVSGAPTFERVREYLHAFAKRVVEKHGDLISCAPNVRHDNHVHLHVSNNAAGRWTIVPYAYRATTGRVATPIHWQELAGIDPHGETLSSFSARLEAHGDVFSGELATMHTAPPLSDDAKPVVMAAAHNPHGSVLAATFAILSDGRTRSAEEIWKIAKERHLVVGDGSSLYKCLTRYIQHQEATQRRSVIVKTVDHKFRINEPPDAWPAVPMPPAAPSKQTQTVIARLHESVKGNDPAAFEVAVCDALSALGFLAQHLGGHGAPDGCADAPLGTLGYRVMVECKSGDVVKSKPNVYEASKYKDAYNAKYCALFGEDAGMSVETMAEIKTHGVALWSIDALVTALQYGLTLRELEPAFAPGVIAEDVMPDILWEREHGEPKRIRIAAEIVRTAGWAAQCAAAQSNTPADAPLLTEDAAMLLVDQELLAQGAHVNCTRDEIRAAFEWLTSELVGYAVWNADRAGIVIVDGTTA